MLKKFKVLLQEDKVSTVVPIHYDMYKQGYFMYHDSHLLNEIPEDILEMLVFEVDKSFNKTVYKIEQDI